MVTDPQQAATALRRAATALDGADRTRTAQAARNAADGLHAFGGAITQNLADCAQRGLPAQRFDRQGGSSGDTSDPTLNAALAQHADGTHLRQHLAWQKALGDAVLWSRMLVAGANVDPITKRLDDTCAALERMMRDHHPANAKRPSTWKACRHGWDHYPSDDGTRCAIDRCGKPWPCREGEDYWHEPCEGRIDPDTSRCKKCDGHGRSWTCRGCEKVHTDGIDPVARSYRCEACYRRMLRAEKGAA